MKKFKWMLLISWLLTVDLAQSQSLKLSKPVIDTSVLDKWPSISPGNISNDGRYIWYTIDKQPAHSRTLVIKSVNNKWQKSYAGASVAVFSTDNNWVVFKAADSVCIVALGGAKQINLTGIINYQPIQYKGKSHLLCLTRDHDLILWDLSGADRQLIKAVSDYTLSADEKNLIWQDQAHRLHYRDLRSNIEQIVHQGKSECTNINYDAIHHQLAFAEAGAIWYWKKGLDNAVVMINNESNDVGPTLMVNADNVIRFSQDGKRIFFYLTEKQSPQIQAPKTSIQVNVWSYKDEHLQSEQILDQHPPAQNFIATLDLSSNKVVRLANDGEDYDQGISLSANNYLLLFKSSGNESWWRKQQQGHVSLVSLKDGSRIFKKTLSSQYFHFDLSPLENYVVYYDPFKQGYCSYDIATGKEQFLTGAADVRWEHKNAKGYPDPNFDTARYSVGFAGWLDGGNKVLVYDNWDIWALDPSGKQKPLCITHGFGQMHNVKFTLSFRFSGTPISGGYDRELHSGEQVILQGLNHQTEEVGLYSLALGDSSDPTPIVKGNYDDGSHLWLASKAKDKDAWLLKRSSMNDASNLFLVEKGVVKTRLTDLQPQKAYNWYTTELVDWKLPNGENCQGVLYKPENLDTTKKYPLIFNYYEVHRNHNAWLEPRWINSSDVDIPYFTSRGYLVFVPDIHYEIGHAMQSALSSVVSAANYLVRRSYVDKSKMALTGHSWGGFETNYIVTHSNLFAAAAEGAGGTDWISNYNSILDPGPGNSIQWLFEVFQNRVGSTLWESPQLYIENSPILSVNNVSTPLLMLHNRLDSAVPWQQAVELFTALRRLNKKAWLLEYDNETHELDNHINAIDYTIRLTQFFDHYLKGAPPPVWMTEGIPAADKGIKTGLELDTTGKQP